MPILRPLWNQVQTLCPPYSLSVFIVVSPTAGLHTLYYHSMARGQLIPILSGHTFLCNPWRPTRGGSTPWGTSGYTTSTNVPIHHHIPATFLVCATGVTSPPEVMSSPPATWRVVCGCCFYEGLGHWLGVGGSFRSTLGSLRPLSVLCPLGKYQNFFFSLLLGQLVNFFLGIFFSTFFNFFQTFSILFPTFIYIF